MWNFVFHIFSLQHILHTVLHLTWNKRDQKIIYGLKLWKQIHSTSVKKDTSLQILQYFILNTCQPLLAVLKEGLKFRHWMKTANVLAWRSHRKLCPNLGPSWHPQNVCGVRVLWWLPWFSGKHGQLTSLAHGFTSIHLDPGIFTASTDLCHPPGPG